MVIFKKLDELVERPRDLWIGYYPSTIDLVFNEILNHSKKRMMIIGRSFHEEENSLKVAMDLVSPCRDSLPPVCTQICKEIKIEGIQ